MREITQPTACLDCRSVDKAAKWPPWVAARRICHSWTGHAYAGNQKKIHGHAVFFDIKKGSKTILLLKVDVTYFDHIKI
ncbi:hypothetical protein [Candidatus Rhodobacter oscarellae]|uniref:hypothetical protein n=1 Tax=Candidatus Rhodobacter oscarellae TaxID=1675527 RepID=UPI00128EE456|nr:hypothetical protein [Candidatus Rhodobacter lobularis]